MYSNPASDIFTLICMILFVVVVVSFCCSGEGSTSNQNNYTKQNTSKRSDNYYSGSSYSECPACGAPHYNGFCEECGYPDINQGWLGENG
ncbi:hypothetical protein [Methanobrevibacter sp.]|uniref:hypothetical protein n=1 Tax=Methanobrevibacter sp. TaxID=66852 RepID=UPI003890A2F7